MMFQNPSSRYHHHVVRRTNTSNNYLQNISEINAQCRTIDYNETGAVDTTSEEGANSIACLPRRCLSYAERTWMFLTVWFIIRRSVGESHLVRHGVFPDSCCSRSRSNRVELMTIGSGWFHRPLCKPESDLQWHEASAGCPRSKPGGHRLQTEKIKFWRRDVTNATSYKRSIKSQFEFTPNLTKLRFLVEYESLYKIIIIRYTTMLSC